MRLSKKAIFANLSVVYSRCFDRADQGRLKKVFINLKQKDLSMTESLNQNTLTILETKERLRAAHVARIAGEQINLPVKPQEFFPFIKKTTAMLKTVKEYLKGNQFVRPEEFQILMEKACHIAELSLRAQFELGRQIRRVAPKQGRYNNKNQELTKREIVKQRFGITERIAKDCARLTEEAVEEAILEAQKKREPVTRALALAKVAKKQNQEKTIKFDLNPIYADEDLIVPKHDFFNKPATRNIPEKKIPYGVLFANVGIEEFWIDELGYSSAVMSEYWPKRAEWYKSIYKDTELVVGDIQIEANKQKFIDLFKQKNCELLLASPPCQTFTKNGPRDFTDTRTYLFMTMMEIIEKTQPKHIMIENVPEFLPAAPRVPALKGGNIGSYIQDTLKSWGYTVNIELVNAADYGSAQSRIRAIILASKVGLWKFPKKDKNRKLLFEVIGDLPRLESGEYSPIYQWHYAPELQPCEIAFLECTPSGCSAWDNAKGLKPVKDDGSPATNPRHSSYARKDWNKPCNTITSDSGDLDGNITIHPGRQLTEKGKYSDSRVLSILELLRVSDLPDWYPIPVAPRTDDNFVRTVIGEAMMPLLLERLLLTIPQENNSEAISKVEA